MIIRITKQGNVEEIFPVGVSQCLDFKAAIRIIFGTESGGGGGRIYLPACTFPRIIRKILEVWRRESVNLAAVDQHLSLLRRASKIRECLTVVCWNKDRVLGIPPFRPLPQAEM